MLIGKCSLTNLFNRFNVDMTAFPIISRIVQECSGLPEFKTAHPDNQPDAPK